ncbi:hypothetical protein FHW12_000882 [Dokdonella fugitiva]|uniref:Uncharacterized protein n=1 Tax=Dokdonella fugitiva TaxID=328517 RepID=A0A839F3C0_9GAMM|nr:hypothetical protein [Dokdonella fugitiva]MBA8886691.1 hypothetical protein [Dokdonella fugitiva]
MHARIRYDSLDLTPPKGVAACAERGLLLRRLHHRGGTAVGVARARDLASRRQVSPATVRRMVSFFTRHAVDAQAPGWADRDEPSTGYIAWLLWGGDPGRRWAEKLVQRMQRIDGGAGG